MPAFLPGEIILRAIVGCVLFLAPWGCCLAQDSSQPVEATLCDLYERPEQYDGKMIKVRAGSINSLDIADITRESEPKSCSAYMSIIVVFPYQTKPAPGFDVVRDESYEKLTQALAGGVSVHIDATYEGRFGAAFTWRDHKHIRVGRGGAKGYGKKHWYDGQIVLHQVSDVWVYRLPRY